MKLNKLTARQVETLKGKGPFKVGDGGGLWLKSRRKGDASWLFSYSVDGYPFGRQLGLGPLHTVSLAEARERARQARQCLLDGVDPIEDKLRVQQAKKLEALRTTTFAQAAEQFMATDAVQRLANDRHRKQWRTTIEEACKTIGALPLEQIDSAIMLKTLLPIWERAPETASRVRGRCERIFAWALAHKLYQGTNPASLDVLRDALPAKPRAEHFAALPYQDMPAFMQELRARASTSARALELAILCASRTSEVLGMTWGELDLDAATWTVPGSRMKAKREHVVALSAPAVALLRDLPRKGEHVFGNGRPLSNMALLQLLRGMRPGFTVHGCCRASFKTWAREQTSFAREVQEAALAHAAGDKVERSYIRGDNMLAKRARLMSEWAKFLTRDFTSKGDNVRKLRA